MVNTLRLTGPCPPPGQGEMSTGETHIMVNFARILGVGRIRGKVSLKRAP